MVQHIYSTQPTHSLSLSLLQSFHSASLDLIGAHCYLHDCDIGAWTPGGGHGASGLSLAAAGIAGEEGDGCAAGVEQAHSAQFAASSCGCTFSRCTIPQQHGTCPLTH